MKKVIWRLLRTTRLEIIFLKLSSLNNFFRRFIPRHQYYSNKKRIITRHNINYCLDVSDYTQWKIFSYNKDVGSKLAYRSLKKERSVVLDIGSNVGEFSFNIISQFLSSPGRSLTVYAFEPNPTIYNILEQNVLLNNFPDRIQIKTTNIGLGSKRDKLKMNVIQGHSGASSLLNDNGNITVDIWPLDDFMPLDELYSVDFIKIDVECFEPFVLQGSVKIIKKFKPIIYLEHSIHCSATHNMGEDFIFNFFLNNGYRMEYELDGKLFPIKNFKDLKAMGKVDILASPLTLDSQTGNI